MSEGLFLVLVIANGMFIGLIGFLIAQNRALLQALSKANKEQEVNFFEYVEDNSGAIKNSRKYVVKGQIVISGLPVGPQFVVSEHLIEEFSYEKLKLLKSEVIHPIINAGLAMKSGGGAAIGAVASAVKSFKPKAG